MIRAVLVIRDVKYNANGVTTHLLAGKYEVHSVEPDGTALLVPDFGDRTPIPVHPSEFRWISGSYLPGELAKPQEKANMATRTKKTAKTAPGSQQTLMEDVADEYPEEVTDAADQFAKTHRSHAKAKTAKEAAQNEVLRVMEENNIDKIPIEIDGREKMVVLDKKAKLKIVKRKEPVSARSEDVAAEA